MFTMKSRYTAFFALTTALVLTFTLSTSAYAQVDEEDTPEVVLEAHGAGFYRPGLAYNVVLPDTLEPPQASIATTFDERLRFALDWSGYVNLVIADNEVVGPSEYGDVEPEAELHVELTAAGQDSIGSVLTLAEPGGEPFGSWRIQFTEGFALESADAAAEKILLEFTGMMPPFRSRIVLVESQPNNVKELVLVKYDGSRRQQLTDDNSIALSPSWSRDATKIVFTSFRDNLDADLYIADLEERRLRKLVSRAGTDAAPVFSPNGNEILFAGSNGPNTSLYLVNMDGTNLRRLTGTDGIDTSPSWSPTGRELVFMSDRNGQPHIYRMDRHGANLRRLTYEGSYNSDPAWSPTGERIVYIRREANGFQVRSMDPLGDVDVALTNEPGDHLDPAWSPDGMKITYSYRGRIWVMSADGTNRRQLHTSGLQPDWSPILQ